MKYIDADKLIAEIERLKSVLTDPLCSQGNILGPDWVAGGNKMLNEISFVITSLQQEQPESGCSEKPNNLREQPEVDLEKEIKDKYSRDLSTLKTRAQYAKLARHFYELGLNARKK